MEKKKEEKSAHAKADTTINTSNVIQPASNEAEKDEKRQPDSKPGFLQRLQRGFSSNSEAKNTQPPTNDNVGANNSALGWNGRQMVPPLHEAKITSTKQLNRSVTQDVETKLVSFTPPVLNKIQSKISINSDEKPPLGKLDHVSFKSNVSSDTQPIPNKLITSISGISGTSNHSNNDNNPVNVAPPKLGLLVRAISNLSGKASNDGKPPLPLKRGISGISGTSHDLNSAKSTNNQLVKLQSNISVGDTSNSSNPVPNVTGLSMSKTSKRSLPSSNNSTSINNNTMAANGNESSSSGVIIDTNDVRTRKIKRKQSVVSAQSHETGQTSNNKFNKGVSKGNLASQASIKSLPSSGGGASKTGESASVKGAGLGSVQKKLVLRQQSTVAGINVEMNVPRENKVVSRIDDVVDDEISEATIEDDDDDSPEVKSRNFEFTSNVAMMNILRFLLYYQSVGVILDNPSGVYPPLFNTVLRPIFHYTIVFYYKIFLDILYGIIYCFMFVVRTTIFYITMFSDYKNIEITYSMPTGIRALNEVSTDTASGLPPSTMYYNEHTTSDEWSVNMYEDVIVGGRGDYEHQYNHNMYGENMHDRHLSSPLDSMQQLTIAAKQFIEANLSIIESYLSLENWYRINVLSSYFFALPIFVMTFLFMLQFWEIRDYTNRHFVRNWISNYIADGWIYKGGLNIVKCTLYGCMGGISIFVLIYIFSKQGNFVAPSLFEITTLLCLVFVIVGVIAMIAYNFIKNAETSFVRYVSQNVNYTSAIILKRVVKSKLEMALILIILLYMPILYVYIQSVMVITDWNDTLAFTFRRQKNYYVPCYFQLFKPFHGDTGGEGTCPNRDTLSEHEPVRTENFFRDVSIVQCDSVYGLTIYTISCMLIPLFIAFNIWMIYRIIDQSISTIRGSRWLDVMESLHDKFLAELATYTKDFSPSQRFILSIKVEFQQQWIFFGMIVYYFLYKIVKLIVFFIKICLFPIHFITPLIYIVNRILFFAFSIDLSSDGNKRNTKMKSVDDYGNDFIDFILRGTKYILSNIIKYFRYLFRAFNKTYIVSTMKIFYIRTSQRIRLIHLEYTQNSARKKMKQTINGVSVVSANEVVNPKDAEVGIKPHLQAEWREDLKISARERLVRRMWLRTNKELESAKIEYVSDHVTIISIFDYVVDTSGLFILVAPFTLYRLWFFIFIMFELTLYAFVGAITTYFYHWVTRMVYLLVINIAMVVFTYWYMPFYHVQDRWMDWIGRMMLCVIVVGVIIFNRAASDDILNIGINANGDPKSPFTIVIDVMKLFIQDTVNSGLAILVDVAMCTYIIMYFVALLEIMGVFRAIEKYLHNIRYAMHDALINFLVMKVDQTAFAVENVNIGLNLLQQWDDVVKDQRRYFLIPMPDFRPKNMCTFYENMLYIKWAGLFNLTVANARTSLGLNILHIIMCNADIEIARWIIQQYPYLLVEEDFQRDTPISLALKECSYYLILYSSMNNGLMFDGTNYNDDFFDTIYPEISLIREQVYQYGEYIEEYAIATLLTEKQRQELAELGYFTPIVKKPPAFIVPTDALNSKSKVNGGSSSQSQMKNGNTSAKVSYSDVIGKKVGGKKKKNQDGDLKQMKRYPEDRINDDFESGRSSGWILLGLDVPINNIDNEKYQDSDFDSDEEDGDKVHDIKYGVKPDGNAAKIHSTKDLQQVNYVDPILVGSLTGDIEKALEDENDAGIDLIQNKSSVLNMTKFKRTLHKIKNSYLTPKERKNITFDRAKALEHEVNWKICKYASMLLSNQIYQHCHNMVWDITAYKELNKISASVQGLISQNLALCFNLNPPEGFVRLSEWSYGKIESITQTYEDGDAQKAEAQDMEGRSTNRNEAGEKNFFNRVKENFNRIKKKLLKKTEQNDDLFFSDRVIHYLAECFVASRDVVNLSDNDLSVKARVAWRAIARAMRKKTCTYVVPNVFNSPQQIRILKLYLERNELDDGDAFLLSDVLLNQQNLVYVNVSHNRIGSHGMMQLCNGMKSHQNITTFIIDYNRIGPACGSHIGSWLKASKTLQIVSMAHNRLGDLIRYTNSSTCMKIESAAKSIFLGIKTNTSLCFLDVSFNNLGPELAKYVPLGVMRHRSLHTLCLAGNSIGHVKGPGMIWALSGRPSGQRDAIKEEQQQQDAMKESTSLADANNNNANSGSKSLVAASSNKNSKQSNAYHHSQSSPKKPKIINGKNLEDDNIDEDKPRVQKPKKVKQLKAASLTDLDISHNQLGSECGKAIRNLLKRSKTLTALNISNNYFNYNGGKDIINALDQMYGYTEMTIRNDIHGAALELFNKTFTSEKSPTSLLSLNMSCCGFGPDNLIDLMNSISMSNCTITDLDISNNPFGVTTYATGDAKTTGRTIRNGLSKNKSLIRLNMNNVSLQPTQILPIYGGIANNCGLRDILISDNIHDEPCCLQLATAIEQCTTLKKIIIKNAHMGPKGGGLVSINIERVHERINYVDITNSQIGAFALLPLVRVLESPMCCITTLHLANNDLDNEGGLAIARALVKNRTLTDLDMSSNLLTFPFAAKIGDVMRLVVVDGVVSEQCRLKRVLLNDNPNIGGKGARILLTAFANEWTEHLEMSNVSAGPTAAKLVAQMLRRVTVAWKYLDISRNYMARVGLNQILWSLRQNRRIRVIKLGDNKTGANIGSNSDTLGSHGIGMVRCIRENLTIRELDLSYSGLGDEAGINMFNALVENFSIRKLNLRGNLFTDDCAPSFGNLLQENNIITELNIGSNRFGTDFCYSLSETIERNRSLTTLICDKNNLASAGNVALSDFIQAFSLNNSLKRLNIDGNSFGSTWGIGIAEILSKNSTLEQISIRNNRLDSRAGLAIYNSYLANYHIQQVAISSEEIGDDVYGKFALLYIQRKSVANLGDVMDETMFHTNDDNECGHLYV